MEKAGLESEIKQWSIVKGPHFDASLHVPSTAALEFALNPENASYMKPDAKLRVAAGGILIGILDLLHPHLHPHLIASTDETALQLKAMQQEAGRTIMYSSKLNQDQKAEIWTAYKDLNIPEPAAAQALRALRERGIDSAVLELAEWSVMVLALKEIVPEIKLPVPHRDDLR